MNTISADVQGVNDDVTDDIACLSSKCLFNVVNSPKLYLSGYTGNAVYSIPLQYLSGRMKQSPSWERVVGQ